MSVAIATRFLDEDDTRPIVHKCGEYLGTANDIMITVSCLEEGEGANIEGYAGYAVYAQFHGDVANQDAAICQMDICPLRQNIVPSQVDLKKKKTTYPILWLQNMPIKKEKI